MSKKKKNWENSIDAEYEKYWEGFKKGKDTTKTDEEEIILKEYTNVTYDLEISLKKDVEDQITWLTENYAEEISAFLTGEITGNKLVIDGLLFPYQDVTGASVNVEPKNLVKLRKEYGNECLRIVGHWHSHNTMAAFFSGTDEQFMKEYTQGKPLSVFFVSSTQSKCRVSIILTVPFKIRLDNVPYKTEWANERMATDLRKVISEKVTKREITYKSMFYDYTEYAHGLQSYPRVPKDRDDLLTDEERAELEELERWRDW